ncbi:MAG: hypothetical protein LUE14_03760 [Clostridiales bacterium]|nr:hypothetical protein [Clostridiales bacterium]
MNKNRLMDDTFFEMEVSLEKGKAALDILTEFYFGDPEEKHEANEGKTLLYGYSTAQTMANICGDYIYKAQQILIELRQQEQEVQ